jgi:hypothetical protein
MPKKQKWAGKKNCTNCKKKKKKTQWKNTKHEMKKISHYIPKSNTYPLSRMPMLPFWNAIEPTIYLTLFEWLAPMKESRDILQIFSDRADPAFAHPTYLAYVVLAPVHKISGHLLDICAMEGIVETVSPAVRNYKLRHQVTAHVAKQYLAALVAESGKKIDSKEDKELSGEQIGKLDGITKILLNLPREFQRWNKNYSTAQTNKKAKQKQGAADQPPYESKSRPFDVTDRIHPSFRKCVRDESETGHKTLTLNAPWDIETVSQGLLKGEYDITLKDFNKDPIKSYKMGKPTVVLPRGDTASGTPKRKNQGDIDQEQTAKLHKTKQEDTNSDTEGAINKNICKNLQKITAPKLKANPAILNMANAISLDLVEYFTNNRQNGGKIKKDDYNNVKKHQNDETE